MLWTWLPVNDANKIIQKPRWKYTLIGPRTWLVLPGELKNMPGKRFSISHLNKLRKEFPGIRSSWFVRLGLGFAQISVQPFTRKIIWNCYTLNCKNPGESNMCLTSYNAWDSFILDLFSDTYRFSIQYEYTQTQCVGVAKEVNNKIVPSLICVWILLISENYN